MKLIIGEEPQRFILVSRIDSTCHSKSFAIKAYYRNNFQLYTIKRFDRPTSKSWNRLVSPTAEIFFKSNKII